MELLLSGDAEADRRAALADQRYLAGNRPGAMVALISALERAPNWVAAWVRLGEWLHEGGDPDGAVAAWEQAARLDPSDRLGARVRRALVQGGDVTDPLPPAYVEMLFDQYAPRFDSALTETLDYRSPEHMVAALQAQGIGHVDRALDLGCGTGLAGALLRPFCTWLAGFDLSSNMLEQAREKGLYDHLEKRDITQLTPGTDHYDLIAAADVFNYLGALDTVLRWCAASLAPGGTLAFTVERGDAPVRLNETRRFAHSPGYVEQALRDAGFARLHLRDSILRKERGTDVRGLIVVAGDVVPRRRPRGGKRSMAA